jgi:hypothetical protein
MSLVRASRTPAPVARFAVELPEGHDPSRPYGANLAISPDGSTIVYVGPSAVVGEADQLWVPGCRSRIAERGEVEMRVIDKGLISRQTRHATGRIGSWHDKLADAVEDLGALVLPP